MTGEELAALIRAEIERDSRLQTIRQRIRDGKADFSDSERYAEIEAEITGCVMRNNVLTLEDRQASYVAATRERHKDIFGVFSDVQEQKDAKDGVRIKPQEPPFDEKRAGKIGHALEDKTVPDETIQRRAESATETFIRSQHDDCMKYNAEFRDRAGMTSYIIRDGSAKCCDWCADVSGKYTLDSAPAGIWGRHDNCKCSIQYDAKKGGRQLLRGTSKKWEVVAPDAGAGELHRLSGAEGAGAGAPDPVVFTKEQAAALQANHGLTRGRSSGTMNTGEGSEPASNHWYEQIGTIDPSDKRAAAKLLRDFEWQYSDSQIEHCRVITASGEVYDVHGDRWTVNTTLLGERMRGSTNEHNHVTGESQYSFSWEDLRDSAEDGSKFAIAFDEKYRYTMIFPDAPLNPDAVYEAYHDADEEVGDINAESYFFGNGKQISDEDYQHEVIRRACERLGVHYERKRKS